MLWHWCRFFLCENKQVEVIKISYSDYSNPFNINVEATNTLWFWNIGSGVLDHQCLRQRLLVYVPCMKPDQSVCLSHLKCEPLILYIYQIIVYANISPLFGNYAWVSPLLSIAGWTPTYGWFLHYHGIHWIWFFQRQVGETGNFFVYGLGDNNLYLNFNYFLVLNLF